MPIPCSRRKREVAQANPAAAELAWAIRAQIELCVLLLYDAEVVIAALNLLREIPIPALSCARWRISRSRVHCHLYNHRVCGYNAKVLVMPDVAHAHSCSQMLQ